MGLRRIAEVLSAGSRKQRCRPRRAGFEDHSKKPVVMLATQTVKKAVGCRVVVWWIKSLRAIAAARRVAIAPASGLIQSNNR